MNSLLKYELFNVLRGKWLFVYVLLFAGLSEALLQFGADSTKTTASLMNVVLLVIPLFSTLYSSIYWYNSESFTSLLLTQPTRRTQVYLFRWIAISVSLSTGFILGTTLPLALSAGLGVPTFLLLASGVVLTFIFVALGLLTAVLIPDRMKGIGMALMIWFYLSVVHDALVFWIISALHDYPMEGPSMILTGINPVDLARVTLLMCLDFSALMGYTGAILQRSLSSPLGYALISITLLLWVFIPALLGARLFKKRDL